MDNTSKTKRALSLFLSFAKVRKKGEIKELIGINYQKLRKLNTNTTY